MQLYDKQTFLGLDVTPRWVLWTELENLRREREQYQREITSLERRAASFAIDRNAADARIRELEQELSAARDKISKIDQPRHRGRFSNKEKQGGE